MKTLIAIPCMDQVPVQFAQSLATLINVGECQISFISGSLIYDARNKLAAQAVKFGADYVLWLDSDMVFEPDMFKQLMEHMKDKDIVSGLYFRRAKPFTPVIFSKLEITDEKTTWEGYDDYPENSVFEVEGIGFGCVLLKTSVLIDIASNFKTWFAPIGGVGEDLSFCARARELGYKIWLDSSIKCGHVAHTVITDSFYKAIRGGK